MDGTSSSSQTQKHYSAEIRAPLADIANKVVDIYILDKKGQVLDELKMKLYHLSTGPVKHDHLLKNLKSRLLFDFHIDQYVEVGVTIKDLNIHWKNMALSTDDIYQLSIIVTIRLSSSPMPRKTST